MKYAIIAKEHRWKDEKKERRIVIVFDIDNALYNEKSEYLTRKNVESAVVNALWEYGRTTEEGKKLFKAATKKNRLSWEAVNYLPIGICENHGFKVICVTEAVGDASLSDSIPYRINEES